MTPCNFSIPFSDDPGVILAKARAAVESQNGTFEGDANSGSFEVSVFANIIKGYYKIEGSQLNLTINDKPFLIPCSSIESFLKSKIS